MYGVLSSVLSSVVQVLHLRSFTFKICRINTRLEPVERLYVVWRIAINAVGCFIASEIGHDQIFVMGRGRDFYEQMNAQLMMMLATSYAYELVYICMFVVGCIATWVVEELNKTMLLVPGTCRSIYFRRPLVGWQG